MHRAVADHVRSMGDTHGQVLCAHVADLADITRDVPNCATVFFRPSQVGLNLIDEVRTSPLQFLERAVRR
jgi:hypothetical protein